MKQFDQYLKEKDLSEAVQKLEGFPLLLYLMKHFKMTKEKALENMRDHGQDVTGLEYIEDPFSDETIAAYHRGEIR